MPNWCDNSFSVTHEDPEMIRKFAEGVRNGNLFDTFIPMPAELRETTSPSEPNDVLIEKYGASDWYSWSCGNWGTKWDCCEGNVDVSEDGKSANGWFNTAWAPAIEAYSKLSELGFELSVLYNEPGCAFAGRYTSENGDDYYEYDFSNENWRDNVDDSDVLELLENEYESWLEWNSEEEEEAKQ